MEGSPSDRPSSTPSEHITLHILSPSTEVPNKITFKNCSASTTVADLKAKICHAIPSKPAPERQRLIYRGRPLIQDTVTLRDVLTQEAVRFYALWCWIQLTVLEINTLQEFSLHLVLPPPTVHQNHTASPIPPATNSHGPLPPNIPRNGGLTAAPHYQAVPGGQGGVPHIMPHLVGPHGAPPVPQAPFPPHIQNALQNHLQMLGQQIGAQIATHGNHQTPQGMRNQYHLQNAQQQNFAPASFQQVIAQQQQARSAAGQQGAGGNATGQSMTGVPDTSRQGAATPTISSNPTNGHVPLPATGTVVQENQGPNSESWRMVIQSTSTVSGLNPNLQRVPTPINLGFPQPNAGAGTQLLPAGPSGPVANQASTPGQPGAPNPMQIRMLEQEIAAIQSALARGTAPAPSVFESARTMLRNIENINLTPGLETMLRAQLEGLSVQADQLRASLNSMLLQVISQNPNAQAAPATSPTQTMPLHSNATSSVYILSSPNGPQALLVSPSGTFSTTWHMQPRGNLGFPLITHHHNNHSPLAHPTGNNTNNGVRAPQPRIVPVDGAPAQQQPQAQAQAQANEARDLLRLLLPLGGHIWLLIRLFGFVYFFTAGGSSRRAFLLGGIAFLVFIAQTGIFRPFVRAVWDPLRRHIEGLVAGNDPNIAQRPTHPPNALGAGANDTQHRNGEPTPQEVAARLLQERARRNFGTLREQFRSVERAVALFVGSLVPGFGERHIAARDAAEAVRQAEAREREEAARSEEEAAARREDPSTAEPEGSPGDGNQTGAQERAEAQAPLVEI